MICSALLNVVCCMKLWFPSSSILANGQIISWRQTPAKDRFGLQAAQRIYLRTFNPLCLEINFETETPNHRDDCYRVDDCSTCVCRCTKTCIADERTDRWAKHCGGSEWWHREWCNVYR